MSTKRKKKIKKKKKKVRKEPIMTKEIHKNGET